MEKKNIVVLGAGFGGLRTARLLAKYIRHYDLTDHYEVILINRNDQHTYTPLLYEVATTSKETADACKLSDVTIYPISLLIGSRPITFLEKEVIEINVPRQQLLFKDGEKLSFRYLVLAMGAETNYFNIPGLRQYSFPLKTFMDAIRIRNRIWMLTMEGQEAIRIIIGGAGPTGVELAGELRAWCRELEIEFKRCKLQIMLIEGEPTVLPGFDARIIAAAKERLEYLGVEILTNEKIASIEKDMMFLGNGRTLPHDICIWTGGVHASLLTRALPFVLDHHGRVLVNAKMECQFKPGLPPEAYIYALGDVVCFHDPKTQQPVPSIARAALSEATIIAHNVMECIKESENPNYILNPISYIPRNYPYILPIGGKFALAKIGPFFLSSFWGWALKGLIELNYLLSIMSPFRAFKTWIKGLMLFIKNDRLG